MRIWDPATGTATHILTGHTDQLQALLVAPDGRWLASAGQDGTVRIWDPVTGTATRVVTGHTAPVQALAVAPDGGWLASAGQDGTVRIWDPSATSAAVAALRADGELHALCVVGKARLAAVGDHGVYRLRVTDFSPAPA